MCFRACPPDHPRFQSLPVASHAGPLCRRLGREAEGRRIFRHTHTQIGPPLKWLVSSCFPSTANPRSLDVLTTRPRHCFREIQKDVVSRPRPNSQHLRFLPARLFNPLPRAPCIATKRGTAGMRQTPKVAKWSWQTRSTHSYAQSVTQR